MSQLPIVWDNNDTNTDVIPDSLLNDGYPFEGIPTSKVLNELFRNITLRLVDLETLYSSTGDVKSSINPTPSSGWILWIEGTIGNAASAATVRANADTEELYTMIWTNASDTNCPVTGGRGASAAADFAANKPIALPKTNGRVLFNLAGTYNLADYFGETTVTLTEANLPTITPVVNDPGHSHLYTDGLGDPPNVQGGNVARYNPTDQQTGVSTTGITISSFGSDTPHENRPEGVALNFHMKL